MSSAKDTLKGTLRIAVVSEGPTDKIVIEAVLATLLPQGDFIVTLQQPEFCVAFGDFRGEYGTGWKGVLRWCDACKVDFVDLTSHPLFRNFDVLIIHLDADIADETDIKLALQCPPASATTDRLRDLLCKRTGMSQMPGNIVLCVPSKATEAWVLAALYPDEKYSTHIECVPRPADRLAGKPATERLVSSGKKLPQKYEHRKDDITEQWPRVRLTCAEAQRFDHDLRRAVGYRLVA